MPAPLELEEESCRQRRDSDSERWVRGPLDSCLQARPNWDGTPAPRRRDVAAEESAKVLLRPGLSVHGLRVDVSGGLESEVVLPTPRCLEPLEHVDVH